MRRIFTTFIYYFVYSIVWNRREDFDFDGAQDLKDNSLETKEDDGLNAENLGVENRIDNRTFSVSVKFFLFWFKIIVIWIKLFFK